MSEHEELVKRCRVKILEATLEHDRWESVSSDDISRAVLREVLRTLETVTPEMEEASDAIEEPGEELWLAMLRASPLVPHKGEEPRRKRA